ncbi:hypothetical protein C1T31_07935 [Hanstruepera neustonica]|uniref:Uncharacterized protein n=1 Tax=Hanstruepera neustonica TaxID=1445657 RepID=A0A2K1DZJ4_9FLAO|nr:hypothetical protein [Hanstruepera neustonica]PNQ73431.1 hypothetical protein C1T31_07935 [Hanstruepera neustonica]
MNKHLFILIIAIVLSSCAKKQDPFLISKKSIGLLTDSTQVQELKTIYKNDSLVYVKDSNEFVDDGRDIEIFDTSGKPLLVLTPNKASDSTATIETVKIMDSRFKTAKGLSISSSFGDIEKNYKISSIQNTFKNIVVFVNEIDAFFTIDKKELPAELQFNLDAKIEAVQIPNKAKIKYFMIGW